MVKTNKNNLILLTGANGFIGRHLKRHLVNSGYQVRAIYHYEAPASQDTNVENVTFDLSRNLDMKDILHNVDIVLHLASKLHINSPNKQVQDDYHKINVNGTLNLLNAAGDSTVQRFVYFSTINVYGHGRDNIVFNEESRLRPETPYAQSKVDAEDLVIRSGVPYSILRLAAVYGDGMKGNYNLLLKAIKYHLFFKIGNGANRRTLVHIKDLINAVVLTMEHPAATGQIFNITDGYIHSMNDIITSMSYALGRKSLPVQLPSCIEKLFTGGLNAPESSFYRLFSPCHFIVDKLLEDMAVNGDKIQKQLNFKPELDLNKGWNDTVRYL